MINGARYCFSTSVIETVSVADVFFDATEQYTILNMLTPKQNNKRRKTWAEVIELTKSHRNIVDQWIRTPLSSR